MEHSKGIQEESMITNGGEGRDELNLAEFPLCTLAHRLPAGLKTLHFEDRIWDQSRGEQISRHLTISGSDAFGLPTALDDEVLLGMIQLSRFSGFADRKVFFTRYQLIRLLGWRDDTKSYMRLEESLNRWTGVTLYYRNAWRDHQRKCWVDEKFHVIDNVCLCHRNDRRHRDPGETKLTSAFVWNEVLHRSFQAGNLKAIDFEFFKGIESAIAKRLYRFLDKRFFRRKRWEFDLKELGWNHIGLSRGYDAASLKRKMRTGILELEQKGYLEPMSDEERFRKVCAGQWEVRFVRAKARVSGARASARSTEMNPLVGELTTRGIGEESAENLVRHHGAETIRARVEVFDWLVKRSDPKVKRNPPGFLLRSIQDGYAAPADFVTRAECERLEQEHAAREAAAQRKKRELEEMKRREERERHSVIERFLEGLDPEARESLEREAKEAAPLLQRQLMEGTGSLAAAARQSVIEAEVLRRIRK